MANIMEKFFGLTINTGLLKTGQTTQYDSQKDDGYYQMGVAHSYTVLSAGQYAGTTNIVINGKTHALSNNCVRDNNTRLMWARYVPNADIGSATDGKLFWKQYTITETVTIASVAKTITADAGTPFSATALCVGRKFTVSGSGAGNDGTYTVSAISTSVITVSEAIPSDEASIPINFATTDDLIWDFLDQANANNLGGYNDWRIPNYHELIRIVDLGNCNPAIDTTAFPSTPLTYHWTSSTSSCNSASAWYVYFGNGYVSGYNKSTYKYYVRLVRG